MHRPTLPLQGCPPASRKTMDLSTGAGIPHRSWGSTPSWGYPLGNDPFLPARGDKDVRDWHFSQTPFPVSRTSHTSTKTTNSASRTTAPSKCSSTPRSTPTPSPGPKTATRPEPKPSTMARVRACAWGGDEGTRTLNLDLAKVLRCQLRHVPGRCPTCCRVAERRRSYPESAGRRIDPRGERQLPWNPCGPGAR